MNLLKTFFKYRYPLSLFLLTLLFFNKLITNPSQIISASDILGSAYYPKYFFSIFFNQYHQIPFWEPAMFSGTPFLANPSSGVFYPLYLLFLIIPVGYVFGYLFIIDIFLIGLFTYLFAKKLNLGSFSAFISAVIFMFSGPVVFRIYPGHLYILDAIVWLPLLLYFYESLLKTKKYIFGLLAGITIALTILVGHSQFTFYNLLFSCTYFFIRLFFDYKENKNVLYILKLIFLFLLSFLIGVALSAIQLVPSLELTNLSERAGGISFEFASAFSLKPYQMISFILPYFFGSPFNQTFWGIGNLWEMNGYLGLVPLIFALIAIVFKRNRYVFIFLLSTLISLLFAFGKFTPIYSILFHYIPGIALFRAPSRFLYIYSFSIAILSGFGINYFLNLKSTTKFINKLILISKYLFTISLITLIPVIFIYSQNLLQLYEKYILKNSYAVDINHLTIFRQTLFDIFSLLTFSSIIFISIYLYLTRRIKPNIFKLFILSLIFIQLWLFSYKVIETGSPNELFKTPQVIKDIKKDNSTYRVFAMSGTYSTIAMINGLQILTGYEGVYLNNYRNFLWLIGKHSDAPFESFIQIQSIINPKILDLLNTKYLIWEKTIDNTNFKLLHSYKDNIGNKTVNFYLYENLSYFPRAYIISEDLIKSGKFSISKDNLAVPNLTDINKLKFLTINKSDIQQYLDINKYSANKIIINTSITKAGYLVLSEIWYPGWKAYDNGTLIKVLKGDYIFRSIYLTKGEHKIIFEFEPSNYNLGIFITGLTLAIVLFLIFINLKPKFFGIYKLKPRRQR